MSAPSLKSLQQSVERADWTRVFDARRAGAPWNKLRTRAGLTALGMALLQDSSDIVEQLLALGAPTARIHLQDGNVLSPLGIAMAQENPELVNLLLDAGADPNDPDPADPLSTPPLIAAARRGWTKAMVMLLRCGAHPNAIDGEGKNAWSHLCEHMEHVPKEALATIKAMGALLQAGGIPDESSFPRIEASCRAHADPAVREAGAALTAQAGQARAFRQSLAIGQALDPGRGVAGHDPRL